VFTAAHCVLDRNGGPPAAPQDVRIHVDTLTATDGDLYNVSQILVHPKFQKAGEIFAVAE